MPGPRVPPKALSEAEQACFAECMSGLGRTSAEQECERLDYYIARFQEFLQQAQQQAHARAHRLQWHRKTKRKKRR